MARKKKDKKSDIEQIDVQKTQRRIYWPLFVIFTFGFFNWVGFLYAALRIKEPRYLKWAIYYALPTILIYLLGDYSNMLKELGYFLLFPLYIQSMIHLLFLRSEYLDRLEKLETEDLLLRGIELKNEISVEKNSEIIITDKRTIQQTAQSYTTFIPVDINNATEEEIARLPGFNPLLAKKVVIMRQMTGAFESLDNFARALSLTEDEINAIQNIITFSPIQRNDNIIVPKMELE